MIPTLSTLHIPLWIKFKPQLVFVHYHSWSTLQYILNWNSIQFKFNWRENYGCKLVEKGLKIYLWIWCWKINLKRTRIQENTFPCLFIWEWQVTTTTYGTWSCPILTNFDQLVEFLHVYYFLVKYHYIFQHYITNFPIFSHPIPCLLKIEFHTKWKHGKIYQRRKVC